jgi:hypothetical protein
MRSSVVTLAVLGALLELVICFFADMLVNSDASPGFDFANAGVVLGVVLAIAVFAAAVLIGLGRSGRIWGPALVAAAVVGSYVASGPTGGMYIFGALFVALAGLLGLLVGPDRTLAR